VVEEVILGCAGQVGEDAYVARVAAVKGGVPETVPAYTVNRLCGSGLQALVSAAQAIRAGDCAVAVAGGVESMSRMPYILRRQGELRLGRRVLEDELELVLSDPFGCGIMGETAENVAERFGVSREEQDRFAAESHGRALRAIREGRFREEIVALPVREKDGERLFDTDEHPRETSVEALSRLRPVFREDGTVTAGNSSSLNDGAAALLVTSGEAAARLGLRPKLRFLGAAVVGYEPRFMGYAPVFAIEKVLQKTGLSVADLDVVELNEAFAAQAVAVIRDAGLDPEKTNPNGGAIAHGHPIGATGAILTVKAMQELIRRSGRFAMVTLCIGGGQGIAAIFERVDA